MAKVEQSSYPPELDRVSPSAERPTAFSLYTGTGALDGFVIALRGAKVYLFTTGQLTILDSHDPDKAVI